jgi:hypothetical protein
MSKGQRRPHVLALADDPAWVRNVYVVQGLSWAQIYQEFSVSPTLLSRRLKRFGISRPRTAWNAGTRGATKANQTSFQVGHRPSKDRRRTPPRYGPDHWNWRDGIKRRPRVVMNRIEYRSWRTAVFEKDNYTCQACGSRGGKLSADHVYPVALYPERELDVANGRTLCWPKCHMKHGWNPRRGYPVGHPLYEVA